MSDNTDTTYVPAESVLASVGLSAKKTDEAWLNVIKTNVRKNTELEAQNAVATFTLIKRGHSEESIATSVDVDTRTVKRWNIQGQAILRTAAATTDNAVARVLSACKIGNGASQALVDAATKVDGSDDEKVDKLETLAVSQVVKRQFVTEDEKELSDDTVAEIVRSLPEMAQRNLGTDKPVSAHDMLDAIPNVTESFGIQKKQSKRSPQINGDGAQTVEFHLKAALKDARQIAEDAGEDYTPSPADLQALLKLVEYILPKSQLNADIVVAIEELAKW